MGRMTALATTSLAALCLVATTASAVPVTTIFTARIQDAGGPVDGAVALSFKIFDAETGGTLLWEEVHASITADNGLVYVELGSVDPTTNGLDQTVFTGADAWLEVWVNGNPQSPRLSIGSVPYAVRAATADTLGTLTPGDVALSTHNHAGVYATAAHDHDATYAALSHTHAATDVTSGTLDNGRFSAYSDLTAEGRLDNNAGTDLLTRSQADGRYFTSVTTSLYSTSATPGNFTSTDAGTTWDFCVLHTVGVPGGGACSVGSGAGGWNIQANAILATSGVACAMRCVRFN